MSRYARLLFPVCLALAAAVLTVSAWRIEPAEFDPVGGRLFPFSVALILLVLSVLLVAVEARAVLAAGELLPWGPTTAGHALRVVAFLIVVAVAIALVEQGVVSLVASIGGIIVLGSLVLFRHERGLAGLARPALVSVATAAVFIAVTLFLFDRILGIPLP